jgi:murein DD-endopeptidase MepM/ murein hydrolase activator NlpD
MSSPNLTVHIEPTEGGSVVFLPLAPPKAGDTPSAQLSLRLEITNNEPTALTIREIIVSFPGTAVPRSINAAELPLEPSETGTWYNDVGKNIVFALPAPGAVAIAIVCTGFSENAVITRTMKPHESPVAAKSYLFPARATDLAPNEFWSGASNAHWSGGDQLFAYDLEVKGWDATTNQWSNLRPGTKGSSNQDYLVYDRPIHAMAEGTVIDFRDDLDDNVPGKFPDPAKIVDYSGNHFNIQHGNEVVLYAHLKKGSLNPALRSAGAAVRPGDLLGHAGNTGNTTNPHTHIHAIRGTQPWVGTLRPIPFHDAQVVAFSELPAGTRVGPWTREQGQGLPPVTSAVWPAPTRPFWNTNLRCDGLWRAGTSGQLWRWGYTLPDFQRDEIALRGQGFRLEHQWAYDIGGGQWRYDGIWNQSGADHPIVWGWAPQDYFPKVQSMFDAGFRLIAQQSYDIGGGQRRYDAIWTPGSFGQSTVWGWTLPDLLAKVQELFVEGWRLVLLQAYTLPDGQLRYDAVWNPGAGAQFAVYGWSADDFRRKVVDMFNDGFRLSHQQSYVVGGQRLFDGVFDPGSDGQWAVWGWTGDFFHAKVWEMFNAGFRLRSQQSYSL